MPITPHEALQRTIEHREIFHDEMIDLMRQIMRGEVSPTMIAALVTGLRVKKETVGEIAAAAMVMRELAAKVPRARVRSAGSAPAAGEDEHLVDIVGIQARVLQRLGAKRALIVWGQDGIDEISLGAPTSVAELADGAVREYEIDPMELGFARAATSELAVANAMESRARVLEALEN